MTVTDEPAVALEEVAAATPRFVCWWFKTPDGQRHTHNDLTVAEALALEEKLGVSWDALLPVGNLKHGTAVLETFLARTDPAGAAARIASMTMKEMDEAIESEWGRPDDLPDQYVDGLPKAGPAGP